MSICATEPPPLSRAALPVDAEAMARFLIGKQVVRALPGGMASGRIVETEAYTLGDAANHAFRGRTPRNASMFLPPGHCYVYLAYGTSFMLNVSAEPEGHGAGVLIRALQPLAGIAQMQRNRGTMVERDLARGPGRLAAALAIDRSLDGLDLCTRGPLFLAEGETLASIAGPRIGITRDAHRALRFFVPGNRFVSGSARLNAAIL